MQARQTVVKNSLDMSCIVKRPFMVIVLDVQVSSKRMAGQLICFGDYNFEWHRHYSKTT